MNVLGLFTVVMVALFTIAGLPKTPGISKGFAIAGLLGFELVVIRRLAGWTWPWDFEILIVCCLCYVAATAFWVLTKNRRKYPAS
jgi:hypothetical protein